MCLFKYLLTILFQRHIKGLPVFPVECGVDVRVQIYPEPVFLGYAAIFAEIYLVPSTLSLDSADVAHIGLCVQN